MRIGELASRSGLSHSRIRFYEKIGLLQTAERGSNGYREYASDALVVLDLLATAQAAGFSLDEIRVLLPSDLDSWKHEALVDALRTKIRDIESLQNKLASSKNSC